MSILPNALVLVYACVIPLNEFPTTCVEQLQVIRVLRSRNIVEFIIYLLMQSTHTRVSIWEGR